MVKETRKVCERGGLHLHKFISNSRKVTESIQPSERAAGIKDVDLCHDTLPIEGVLGIQWCVETDMFSFMVQPKEQAPTRRGILSAVASIYDPLGFISPFVLPGKLVLQEMCRTGINWDQPLSENLRPRWNADCLNLTRIKIPRCFHPPDFGNIIRRELHHFSDASNSGYGQCSYLRLLGRNGVHCTLIAGKSRVAPTKMVTIPRLELTAALVSAMMSCTLKKGDEDTNR